MPSGLRRTPDASACADDGELSVAFAAALRARHGADVALRAVVRTGTDAGTRAALAVVVLGDDRRAHELFAFARGADSADVVVDVLDAVVREAVADDDAFLPLDWEGRPYDGGVVFVRGEVRDYLAEDEAGRLLGEPALARAIP